MELFDDYKALKRKGTIYFFKGNLMRLSYDIKESRWTYYKNPVVEKDLKKYEDVEEHILLNACNGRFPEREKDLLERIYKSSLTHKDFLLLLHEDYPEYIDDKDISEVITYLLKKLEHRYDFYNILMLTFRACRAVSKDKDRVIYAIKEATYKLTGIDYFKKDIALYYHKPYGDLFMFFPCRLSRFDRLEDPILEDDYQNNLTFSVKEDFFDEYLRDYFIKYFDENLNQGFRNKWLCDVDVNDNPIKGTYFEDHCDPNLYSFETIDKIIKDIKNLIKNLKNNKNTKATKKAKDFFCLNLYNEDLTNLKYNKSIFDDNNKDINVVIDFYSRFITCVECTIKLGKLKGYNVFNVEGP